MLRTMVNSDGKQSVSLLDRLLFVIRLTASNKETKLAELTELDSKARSFLEVVMSELEWRQTLICDALFQVSIMDGEPRW